MDFDGLSGVPRDNEGDADDGEDMSRRGKGR